MHAKLLIGIIIGIIIVFPLSLSAQDSDVSIQEAEDAPGFVIPDSGEGGLFEETVEEEPVIQEESSDLSDDSFDEYFDDSDSSSQQQDDTDMTETETPEYSPVEDTSADQANSPLDENESFNDPTPTPPQNLTYLDYFYYVRARYDGNTPADVVTDYNGDGKTDEKDKSIILQALNPDYDPATITPSPTPETTEAGEFENEEGAF